MKIDAQSGIRSRTRSKIRTTLKFHSPTNLKFFFKSVILSGKSFFYRMVSDYEVRGKKINT